VPGIAEYFAQLSIPEGAMVFSRVSRTFFVARGVQSQMARSDRWAGASRARQRLGADGHPAAAYLAALLLIGLSVLLRTALRPWLGEIPYLPFFPAILLASWYGGLGPGILATGLGALTAIYFLLPPPGFGVGGAADVVSLGLFTATGIGIAWLNEELRRSAVLAEGRAERLDAIINTSVDGIIVIDARGHIEAFNPAAERLFGYLELEVLGRNVNLLMPSPYREEHDAYIERYLATGQKKIIGIGREVTGRRKDGSIFPLHLSVGEIRIGGDRKFTGVVHDLTARVRMEERLREQTALARLGEMAGLIAHEVKNPLAGIRGAIQVVGSRMPQDAPDAAVLKEIISRIDSLDQMMKELLLFARPPSPKRMPTDVATLISSTAAFLGRDPAWSSVEVDVAGSAPLISADAEMLRIVFQNLMINAAHAMQGRGRIQVGVMAADGFVRATVADSGPGIPQEVREKIFVPFFTTKSRGTGLGLPTAKRLVEAHQGEIAVECPPAGGTIVHVRLPVEPSG
jgi:two-component system sensor kinase FixL